MSRAIRLPLSCLALASLISSPAPASAEELATVPGVPPQPLVAQARRLVEALEFVGQPLPHHTKDHLKPALDRPEDPASSTIIQQVLDPLCLIEVTVNPESRVKAIQGPRPPHLLEQGWRAFLVKVHNQAGVTARLRVESPNAGPTYTTSTNRPDPEPTISPADLAQRWTALAMFDERPLNPDLSGLVVEYRLLQVFSRDPGPREAKLTFDVGQGTQDLGFRSDIDILFNAEPAFPVTLRVADEHGEPTTASFLFRDAQGRVYPYPRRRLAPDLYFHDQVYRHDGESILLPAGAYTVEFTRGPEYVTDSRPLVVTGSPGGQSESFQLRRWADLAARGWYSGDHHVHAAGCGHYESPTEGVRPDDMMRHILGEDLNVGCVLSWGPCWYFQKHFFSGGLHPLSTPDYLMRYDIEVSGFPSSHAGHLCLLRLKEDDYPGTSLIEEWPSWDLPVLKWGKEQGGVVGFSHSGWGLQTESHELPNLEMPPFNGIGANEYIVDVVHDAVDFISAVDTPAPFELNIWYHTLNCGFRARISGETDFPCIYGERVGLGRSYVQLDGPLDFDLWTEGIKQGRSYVGDGRSHLVDFSINGVAIGRGDVGLDAPAEVTIEADVAAMLPPEATELGRRIKATPLDQKPYWEVERARIEGSRRVPVEVVVNGKSVATQEIEADGTFRKLRFKVPIEQSSWVALRIYPTAHTNPIWVTLDGKPVRASRKSADWCLRAVDQCWSQKVGLTREDERDAAEAAYNVARDAYRAILAEATED